MKLSLKRISENTSNVTEFRRWDPNQLLKDVEESQKNPERKHHFSISKHNPSITAALNLKNPVDVMWNQSWRLCERWMDVSSPSLCEQWTMIIIISIISVIIKKNS